MKKYKRIFTIVIDSFGAGAMPDAAQYGDEGTDTMGHISQNVDEFTIPNLQKLGIANLHPLKQVAAVERPMGYYTFLKEASTGKDTMTGHWEMMGLHITKPFKTFTETGFPKELIDELEKRTGHKVIGNKSSSGTEILDELAEEEIATGHMIVYTSADSVLQICGNEETFGLDELYRCCEIARDITMRDEWKVGRVIARPYLGKKKGEFKRTSNRHDYALKPYGKTALNALKDTDNLVARGLLKRVAGVGTFVCHSSVTLNPSTIQGFSETMTNQGISVRTEVPTFTLMSAPANISSILRIEAGEPIYFIERIRYAGDAVFQFETTYMSSRLYPDISIQVLKNSKYKYFEQEKGLKIAYSNHTVTPLHPSRRIAKLFDISLDTPILQVANTTWLTNGQIMDYTVLTLNSPIYQLTYEKR